MNLAQARIVLRPRYRLESADLAFRFVLGEARSVFGWLAVVTLLPAFAVTVAARAALHFPWWLVWLIAVTLGSTLSGVFTVASSRLLFEKGVLPRDVLRAFGSQLGAYLWAMLLSRAAILLGFTLTIPGLLVWARFTFVPEAVLLESQRGPLRRSARISRGGGDVMATVLASAALQFAIVFGVETMVYGILQELLSIPIEHGHLFYDGGSYPALAGYFVSVPWAAAYRFLSYIDSRTRQDAWDVQVRLMALADGEAS